LLSRLLALFLLLLNRRFRQLPLLHLRLLLWLSRHLLFVLRLLLRRLLRKLSRPLLLSRLLALFLLLLNRRFRQLPLLHLRLLLWLSRHLLPVLRLLLRRLLRELPRPLLLSRLLALLLLLLLNRRRGSLAESSVWLRSAVIKRWPNRSRRFFHDHLPAHHCRRRPAGCGSRGTNNAPLHRRDGEIALHFRCLHLLLVDADI
jgi:hypothetical protein